MTVYGYARTSTAEQADEAKASLPEQRRKITGIAMAHSDEDPVIFQDEGVSGGIALRNRPEGKKLTSALRPGDTLIVAKMDRIFRSARDALEMGEDFKDAGIGLIIADMGSEPVNENGTAKLFFTMMAAFAEFEKSRIAERMEEGRRTKRQKGGHIGGSCPYGWRKEGDGKDAVLIEIPEEQETIRLARKYYVQHGSYRSAIAALTAEGRKARNGAEFQTSQIMRMLKGAKS